MHKLPKVLQIVAIPHRLDQIMRKQLPDIPHNAGVIEIKHRHLTRPSRKHILQPPPDRLRKPQPLCSLPHRLSSTQSHFAKLPTPLDTTIPKPAPTPTPLPPQRCPPA